MRYEHVYYRTKDKSLDIEFLMLDLGKPLGWRAYVMSDIDYKRVSAQGLMTTEILICILITEHTDILIRQKTGHMSVVWTPSTILMLCATLPVHGAKLPLTT